jgi:hypothetical protein
MALNTKRLVQFEIYLLKSLREKNPRCPRLSGGASRGCYQKELQAFEDATALCGLSCTSTTKGVSVPHPFRRS